jgi:hypothetical protein
MQLQGAGMRQFLGMIQKFCESNATNAEMIEFILPLAEVTKQWGELTMAVGRKSTGSADEMGAAAVDYLYYSGYVALAYWWARAVAAADASGHPDEFKTMKRETARFYFGRILPRIHGHAAAMRSGAGNLLTLPAASFDS